LKAASYSKEVSRRKRAAEILSEQQEALARSEAAYRQQTKLLRSVLESMGDGVLVADDQGRMVLVNPAAEQMLGPGAAGTHSSQWVQRFGVYVPGTDNPYPTEKLPLARAVRGETAEGTELFIRNPQKPDGMYVSVNTRPLKDDSGNSKGGVAVVRDITLTKVTEDVLRQAKEEAERANRAKSEFLSRMSHELRTPLNSILGFAQLLTLTNLAAEHQENIQQILKGGYHLLELINEVLDLARVEAGRLSLSLEPVQVKSAVKEALDLVRPIASLQNIKVSAEFSANADGYCVQADRQRLKQVLLNLLSNAIKFNSSNGMVVLRLQPSGHDRLRIEVTDTGCGIDEEGLKKIFTPFERLTADRNAVGGTGLGLALSKRMIEAMGGAIGVESTVGLGSRFYCELLIVESAAEPALDANFHAAVTALGQASSYQGTVLYIEDNVSNIRLMQKILAPYTGVRLLEAMQGKTGLEIAHLHTPDWILLDLQLPDMGGEDVLRALREDPLTLGIPVTILSADATPGNIDRLQAAGACQYLTKPLDVRQLIGLLERTLPRQWSEGPDGASGASSSTEPATSFHWDPETISLMNLPSVLVEELRTAVRDGEKARMDKLIAAVADHDGRSAQALRALADRYEYDTLTSLLAESSQ